MAALAIKSSQDARSLLSLLREEPSVFDALWYASFPPPENSRDVGNLDDIMRMEVG